MHWFEPFGSRDRWFWREQITPQHPKVNPPDENFRLKNHVICRLQALSGGFRHSMTAGRQKGRERYNLKEVESKSRKKHIFLSGSFQGSVPTPLVVAVADNNPELVGQGLGSFLQTIQWPSWSVDVVILGSFFLQENLVPIVWASVRGCGLRSFWKCSGFGCVCKWHDVFLFRFSLWTQLGPLGLVMILAGLLIEFRAEFSKPYEASSWRLECETRVFRGWHCQVQILHQFLYSVNTYQYISITNH